MNNPPSEKVGTQGIEIIFIYNDPIEYKTKNIEFLTGV